ncbi:Ras guanine nucleotide exchange factor bud5 [Recurvomyces mirabilis]|nr:Ras guanine nucleotide exchange factor bud5 [Recurvomyces mirabilis]
MDSGITTGLAITLPMTPPESPVYSHDASDTLPAPALFHNYLRAFYPFEAPADSDSGDDALLMTVTIKPGDLILVHSVHANGWADGTVVTTGERGWLPTNYCEAYDHPYLRNLLNAMTQFWDLIGANEDANLSTFVRQDYIRGLIAGVRYLLEHADCLHRDASLVQGHTGIRRMRKGLLADLSNLVQIAKGLQETISEPFAGEVVHYLLDDVITKAFKVVTRAVGFADMWAKEIAESRSETDSQDTRDSRKAGASSFESLQLAIDTSAPYTAQTDRRVDSAKVVPIDQGKLSDSEETSSHQTIQEANGHTADLSERPTITRSGTTSYRLSTIDNESPTSTSLASGQLSQAHDECISHIGAFIGHHLQARPTAELADTTERVVLACRALLAAVDVVLARDSQHSASVHQARIEFQLKLEEVVKATRNVFTFSDSEGGNAVMLPEQTNRLVAVGTSLIRTAGECVARTKNLIEQIGDVELNKQSNQIDERPTTAIATSPSTASEASAQPRILTSFQKRLSRKVLPSLPASGLASSTSVDNVEQAPEGGNAGPGAIDERPSTADSHRAKATPSMRRRSRIRLSHNGISGASLKSPTMPAIFQVDEDPSRKNSAGLSIAGSAETFRSSMRHSGISAVSEVSTRATTPDHDKAPLSPDPGLLDSFHSISSLHTAESDPLNDAETQLLQKTFASELTLNKDGQITGGTLPALIEQLTIHDVAPDPQFVTAFYLTFRMFATPRDFAQTLIARFDYIGDSAAIAKPVRLRVYNVFKGWMETYWSADADKDALGEIRYFALHKLKAHLPSAADRLLETIRKITESYHSGEHTGQLVSGIGKTSIAAQQATNEEAPEPMVSKAQLNLLRAAEKGGLVCSVLEFEPLELARQFSLMTSKIYCAIQPEELLSLDWGTRGTNKARNVRAMCSMNTDLAHIVGDSILAPDDAKKRAVVVKHWSKVATHCLDLNNYDSLMAIMCSLNTSVVQRLKRTWELVSKKTRARLAELNAIIDVSRNSVALRRRLETPVAPCIPFLGIYLTDLTFLDVGNPKTRELPGAASDDGQTVSVINFDKYMRMAKVISHLQKFQVPYSLRPVQEMQAWIESHMSRMRESNDQMVGKFHRRSLVVEPKLEDAKLLKAIDARRGTDTASERPKTGNKERFDMFLRNNHFNLKALTSQESPAIESQSGGEKQASS